MSRAAHDSDAGEMPQWRAGRRSAGDRWLTSLIVALLLLRLLLALAYSLATPLGEAPDEADHFAYAAYILEHRSLPVGPEMTQGKHPPLYHALSALAGRVAGGTADRSFLRANPDMSFAPDSQAANFFVRTTAQDWPWRDGVLTLRAGRFVSILAGLALVAGTFLLGRALWPSRPYLALAAAAFAAFLPQSLFVGGAMSNDMLAAMWATLALWLAARRGRRPPQRQLNALLSGACLGLALVTKASAGSLAVVVAAVLLASDWPGKPLRSWRLADFLRLAAQPLIAGATALAIAAPWLWRNWQLYGDPFGWPLVLATIDQRQGPLGWADIAQLGKGWWLSFWGKFGGAGHIPLPTVLYIAWAVLGAAAVVGWLRWLARRRQPDSLLRETTLSGWIILLGGPLVIAAGIYSYSKLALGTDQGRLLFPALAPLALLIVGGLAAWIPRQRERAAAFVFAGGMALMAAAALWTGLVGPFAPPPEPLAAQVAQADAAQVGFGPLELVATQWSQGDMPALTLYWRAAEPTSDDLRTAVRLLDREGALLWEWKRSPGAGRFSTDRWPAGRVVADVYRIPADVLGRAATVEVGLRPFPEGTWLAPAGRAEERLTLPMPAQTGYN